MFCVWIFGQIFGYNRVQFYFNNTEQLKDINLYSAEKANYCSSILLPSSHPTNNPFMHFIMDTTG